MIIIYDFHGTLTPYSLPQYEILKKCGYDDKKMMQRIEKEINNKNATGLYDAYYKCYIDILSENQIKMTKDNICLGVDKVQLNNGVNEYFRTFQSSKTGIKHYIITAGIKDYVNETSTSEFVDGIYGVTFNKENGIHQVIYFGDGLTDIFAFKYVHSIGGKNVFVLSNKKSMFNYKKLNAEGIIDECFEADFGLDSKISKYIKSEIVEEKGISR